MSRPTTREQQLVIQATRLALRLCPFSRGKQTLAHHVFQRRLTGLHQTVHFSKNAVRYDLNLFDRIQAIFYLTGLYEEKTVSAACKILQKAPSPVVVFDVGANVGLLSLQIKAKVPQADLHLFEADPDVFSALSRNIELNHLHGIHLNHRAVSAINGETLNFVKSDNPIESGWGRLENETHKHSTAQRQQVMTVSIDQYVIDHGIAKIDVLKIDVEGAEERVLLGCAQSFRERKIKSVICEMHPTTLLDFGSSAQRILDLLTAAGFKKVRNVDLNVLFELPDIS